MHSRCQMHVQCNLAVSAIRDCCTCCMWSTYATASPIPKDIFQRQWLQVKSLMYCCIWTTTIGKRSLWKIPCMGSASYVGVALLKNRAISIPIISFSATQKSLYNAEASADEDALFPNHNKHPNPAMVISLPPIHDQSSKACLISMMTQASFLM